MTDFEKTVLADLAELKVHMRWLLSSNPGCMRDLHRRLERQERFAQRLTGIGAALGLFITLVHIGIDWLRR